MVSLGLLIRLLVQELLFETRWYIKLFKYVFEKEYVTKCTSRSISNLEFIGKLVIKCKCYCYCFIEYVVLLHQ